MSTASPDEVLAEARHLETDAMRVGEDRPAGRELLAQAAQLRIQALGAKVYPVLVCATCYHLTGWTSADGSCDSCLRRAQSRAAYTDPHAGWVSVEDTRQPSQRPSAPPLRKRIAALTGRRAALDRAVAQIWLLRVEPDETGPISPEDGYELEVAKRDEVDTADHSGIVVQFATATYRFAEAGWVELGTTRIARRDILVPPEFSAALPIEQLAEAWGDYRIAVEAFNRRAWAERSQQRETERLAQDAREDALRQQRHVSELLDER